MTTGEKIQKLRKEKNMTQDELADYLLVSRQSVSKWESDLAYPETNKIIQIAELFDVTVDYLLKDKLKEKTGTENTGFFTVMRRNYFFEYKSKKKLFGLPLIHVNIGLGRVATGFIAIGLISKGIISLGLLSLGIISIGLLSLGILSLGTFALGLFSAGAISVGLISAGAISVGLFSVGAISVGEFAVGALSVGHYAAYGDHAYGMIALGDTVSSGSLFQGTVQDGKNSINAIENMMNDSVPEVYNIFKDWFLSLLR